MLLGSEVDCGNIRIILHQLKCLMTEVCGHCSQCVINTADGGVIIRLLRRGRREQNMHVYPHTDILPLN